MKIEELRIGNLVRANKSKLWTREYANSVVTVDIDIFINICFNKKPGYMPIPLTKKWLLKMGFTEDQDGYYVLETELIGISWDLYDGKVAIADYIIEHIRYVHQLQNLYFALTGQELTIK